MSGNIFVDCLFLFLICYALTSIFYDVSDFLMRKYCRYPQRSFIVVEVSHNDCNLECDIRCALSKSLKQKCALIIVCNELDFDEHMLLWRLADCYDHVVECTPEELPKKLATAAMISASQ